MSATRQQRSQADQQRQQRQPASGAGLPAASLPESLAAILAGVLPAIVRGLFSPRRRAMRVLTSLDADRRAVSVLAGLRRRHGGDGVRLLGGRIVLLWGSESIQEVLDHSADTYAADSGAKAKGMSHFQPDALTLSRGEEWRERRAFNEAVLSSEERLHPFAERFLAVVQDEVERMHIDSCLDWPAWERLFDHVTLRVIFGDRARENEQLTALLEKLMREANRLVGLSETDDYYEFYGLLERALLQPEPGTLLARFAQAPQSDRTRVVHQIPHWMFAMRDTLGANVFRALAAIVADPEICQQAREEIGDRDLADPAAVDGLGYLEGCLQEAMRLWPTTPLLTREATQETTLAGQRLDEGTQVMLVNVFNHRDPGSVDDPDRLQPERWRGGARDYRFNHLSNGSQDCPGGPLVSLLGKAVLAQILRAHELTLEPPTLPGGRPLPHMLNFYEVRFGARPRRAA